jgi:hypothetical protein
MRVVRGKPFANGGLRAYNLYKNKKSLPPNSFTILYIGDIIKRDVFFFSLREAIQEIFLIRLFF